MTLKLGPAGVPLSCKGRTIVEGMDDITVLGLDAIEVQTVRTIQPQHFDQYWQAGILSWNSKGPTSILSILEIGKKRITAFFTQSLTFH